MINNQPSSQHLSIGIIVYPDVEPLDVTGPYDVLRLWRDYNQGPTNIFAVGQDSVEFGLGKFTPKYSFESCPPCDVLFVPGGKGVNNQLGNDVLLRFINAACDHDSHIIAVCSGSLLLAKAGLLDGKEATSHIGRITSMREQYPAIIVVQDDDRRVVVSERNIWTSRGITSGLDAALCAVARYAGIETAEAVRVGLLEYKTHPDYEAVLTQH